MLTLDKKSHRLAAGSFGGEVRVYDVENGKLLRSFVAAPK